MKVDSQCSKEQLLKEDGMIGSGWCTEGKLVAEEGIGGGDSELIEDYDFEVKVLTYEEIDVHKAMDIIPR